MTNSSSYMSCRDFLQAAIVFEEESADFYHRMQAGLPAGAVRELLKLLELQETAHAVTLRGFRPADGDAIIQFALNLASLMEPAPAGEISLSALIELGIERERRAKEAYFAAARSVTGSFREMLEGLARFEEEHEERLKSLQNM
jgi:rubrerythrin